MTGSLNELNAAGGKATFAVAAYGAAQHTYTAACDGFHEPGPCPVPGQGGGEPAKVIIVTETGGRERRFSATYWEGPSHLSVRTEEDGEAVALYAPGAWLSVREDGAEMPDGAARALGIAKRALSEIVRRADDDGGEQPFGRPEISAVAAGALDEIWTETEG